MARRTFPIPVGATTKTSAPMSPDKSNCIWIESLNERTLYSSFNYLFLFPFVSRVTKNYSELEEGSEKGSSRLTLS